jgi:hypothetical protein
MPGTGEPSHARTASYPDEFDSEIASAEAVDDAAEGTWRRERLNQPITPRNRAISCLAYLNRRPGRLEAGRRA